MLWIKKLMGWILVGMAAYFLQPILLGKTGGFLMAGIALAAGLIVHAHRVPGGIRGGEKITSGDGKSTGWISDGSRSLRFEFGGQEYVASLHWQSTSGFDDLQYTLTASQD